MIPDLCSWVYDYAISWVPSWASLGLGEEEEGTSEEPTSAPGTAEALARARDALVALDRAGAIGPTPGARPPDARFRTPLGAGLVLGGGGVDRLVVRLQEIDVAGLAPTDREVLQGAARHLLERLHRSMS